MITLIAFVAGTLFGLGLFAVIGRSRKGETETIAKQMEEQMKNAFGALSMEALKSNTSHFLQVAKSQLQNEAKLGAKELDGKKQLIDQTLLTMNKGLEKVEKLMTDIDKSSAGKFGEISQKIEMHAKETQKLQQTTDSLKSALASTKTRGQWGERMADDVLRLAGFIENINFRKNKALETGATRPDYSFILPNNMIVNMDVKFPFNNYQRYLDAANDQDRVQAKNAFLKDVRDRLKEVQTRNYVNPDDKTVDYVIIFIPNEQVYSFIHESDSTMIDDALMSKVILCSPMTLYAVLGVIRQSMDNFMLQQTASQMLTLFGAFNQQWKKFQESMEKMGKSIGLAQKEFDYLSSTRRRQLERPLEKIEELRVSKGIVIAEMDALPELIDEIGSKKDKNISKSLNAEQVTMAIE